ncbi:unnamed protein product [Polarella glacialis]|uniref:Pre-mRNA-splicing factor CWC15 n=1 Tax=Polarella glacialis TaxID=89957 RepID=A0A813LFH6_POLGL|nr:unnamed protein product [Polarella glacialis]CAE8725840.1 unnamed protein product [Polarella glacialis]|mmetsp:Transcript_6051/g.9699  ORF Transcript_6051/g.9699 Transcript_6051/m.9699 type:complete len:222 (-) Transcript_6051:94-759(-)|eukprot:CAMPEP_0115102016 /NCGR_PEP_ID=MMETSP0227-20121206/33607_1 /TAXON_ID=89957 /ORGANISM="Polarella glacialis, Strain CCMP 1383" /LENGTH=221 /DNA_ID=CAMNT_0002497939 /DNA_START=64 /DNA_END=729 /DNA_ORIENTATION=+
MTTAHRPTFHSAIASNSNPSGNVFVCNTTKIANRDAASFRKLKTRQPGQGLVEERGSRADLRDELEKKEKDAKDERSGKTKPKAIEANPFPEDADDDAPSEAEKSEKEDSDDGDDDEDTEELMRELAKIKKEREEEEDRHKAQQAKVDARSMRDEVMKGNPLLDSGIADTSLKRKWDDQTVFKNQSKTVPKGKTRYINDSVRSDFHKKFLNKYVWVDGISH